MDARQRAIQAIESSTIPPQHSQWWAILISPEQVEALTQAIERAIKAAKEEATKKERARCLEMINRCVHVYQGHAKRAEARDNGEDPTFYPTVNAEDTWAKATGAEYAHFVVGDWSLGENFRDDQMPMPF